MKAQCTSIQEYEVISYPRLNHVQANIVQIVNRNTHVHRTMEIGLVLEGDGIMRVSDNSFPVHRGSLYFFNAGQPHEIIAVSKEGLKIAYQMVARGFCGEYIPSFRNLEILKNDLTTYLKPVQSHELTARFVEFMEAYLAPDSDTYALECISSICRIFTKLLEYVPYRKMTDSDYSFRNKKMARLSRITEYIDTNYAKKISLEALAQRENVTKTYLSHFIHENLNMTFQEYVSSVRFERALKLIRNSAMNLTDISSISGFSDVKYLSKMLEKRFGKPAQKCCAQLRQEAEQPAREEDQTFPTAQTGRDWLAAFREGYMKTERMHLYE